MEKSASSSVQNGNKEIKGVAEEAATNFWRRSDSWRWKWIFAKPARRQTLKERNKKLEQNVKSSMKQAGVLVSCEQTRAHSTTERKQAPRQQERHVNRWTVLRRTHPWPVGTMQTCPMQGSQWTKVSDGWWGKMGIKPSTAERADETGSDQNASIVSIKGKNKRSTRYGAL